MPRHTRPREYELARCGMNDLTWNSEQFEPDVKTAGHFESDRKQIKKQGAIATRCQAHELGASVTRHKAVKLRKVCRFSAERRPAVHELHRQFSPLNIRVHHRPAQSLACASGSGDPTPGVLSEERGWRAPTIRYVGMPNGDSVRTLRLQQTLSHVLHPVARHFDVEARDQRSRAVRVPRVPRRTHRSGRGESRPRR